ncbi:hypothetical protein THAOC_37563, partial [Thalassiosira oceanica]
ARRIQQRPGRISHFNRIYPLITAFQSHLFDKYSLISHLSVTYQSLTSHLPVTYQSLTRHLPVTYPSLEGAEHRDRQKVSGEGREDGRQAWPPAEYRSRARLGRRGGRSRELEMRGKWRRPGGRSSHVSDLPAATSCRRLDCDDSSSSCSGGETDSGALSKEMLELLKVDELKARLKKQGLSTTGRKIKLIERLLTAPAKEEQHDNEQDAHGANLRTQLNKCTNAELKAMLKGKRLSQQGNKSVLIDRLLGKEQKKARKVVKWKDSKARQLLSKLINNDESLIHGQQAKDVYESEDLFQDYPFKKFEGYFISMVASAAANRKQAQIDNAIISKELAKFPRKPSTIRGYPYWDTSPAAPLLRQDVKSGKSRELTPKDLRLTRKEYQVYPLDVFRDHIYQERRKQKENDMKVVQRNKLAMKNHLHDIERREALWEDYAGALKGLKSLKLGN